MTSLQSCGVFVFVPLVVIIRFLSFYNALIKRAVAG
jgi:hypothetical protein